METKTIARVNNVDILAMRSENQLIPIRQICEALGIDEEGQRQRINRDEILNSVACMTKATGADGKQYEMLCLPLGYVFGWLFSVDTSRVAPEAKSAVIGYKLECYSALYNYFAAPQTFLKEKQKVIEAKVAILKDRRKDFRTAKGLMQEASKDLERVMAVTQEEWEANNRQLLIDFSVETENDVIKD